MQSDNEPLYQAISSGEFDGELYDLKAALDRRMNVLFSRSEGPFAPGTEVRFKENIRPKLLAGALATVVHTNGKGRNPIHVDLKHKIGVWSKDVRVSPAHIEPISV